MDAGVLVSTAFRFATTKSFEENKDTAASYLANMMPYLTADGGFTLPEVLIAMMVLAIGLTIIAAIIYAMAFIYR